MTNTNGNEIKDDDTHEVTNDVDNGGHDLSDTDSHESFDFPADNENLKEPKTNTKDNEIKDDDTQQVTDQ